jgi:prepilin-type N-terminal cleavage/methylation domain-containing protein
MRYLKDNKGFTLVEMIVSFALLTIFMAAIAATLAPVSKQYTKMQKINHMQNIEDGVLEQVRSYLVSADSEADGGYIKLRSVKEVSGVNVPATVGIGPSPDSVTGKFYDHTGSVIEFKKNGFAAVLDTRGYKGYKCKNPNSTDVIRFTDYFVYDPGYLSIRYFLQAADKTYYDRVEKGSVSVVIQNESDTNKFTEDNYTSNSSDMGDTGAYWTAYGAYECFDKQYYMGYQIKVTYTIPQEAIKKEGDNVYISYLLATCRISDTSLSDASQYAEDTLPIYFKEPMRYENGKTSPKYDS